MEVQTKLGMVAEAQELSRLFASPDRQFIIPLYQRNYDWGEKQCKQLLDDLVALCTSERGQMHFFGNIVLQGCSHGDLVFVIDGQQRITTISLILLALVRIAESQPERLRDPSILQKINEGYLVNRYDPTNRKLKLKMLGDDAKAFEALIHQEYTLDYSGSAIQRNYLYMYEALAVMDWMVDDLFEAVNRLSVIKISLLAGTDAQRIFESLNSTGLRLSEADKIRNYLLMSLDPDLQEACYTNHWSRIELCSASDPSAFIRDYLTMKQGRLPRKDSVYTAFKSYAQGCGVDREQLLSDLSHYADIYRQIEVAGTGAPSIDRRIEQLRTLSSRVAHPYFLAYLDYAVQEGIPVSERAQVLSLIENFWARRIICAMSSASLNKIFATLHREVLAQLRELSAKQPTTYAEALTQVLLSKSGSSSFPSDAEVSASFSSRQVYKIGTDARLFLLERLENRDSEERHEVVKGVRAGKITIEHIMPQTLSPAWIEMLGQDWRRIHDQYLHTMANLTLTAYNAEYSNKPFLQKKTEKDGFSDSAFRLNAELRNYERWTEAELRARGQRLLDAFLLLWPMPQTRRNTSGHSPAREVTLADESFNGTHAKLIGFSLRDKHRVAASWRSLLPQVIEMLGQTHPDQLEELYQQGRYGFATRGTEYTTKISEGHYVRIHDSAANHIARLRNLLRHCGYPLSDLRLELE